MKKYKSSFSIALMAHILKVSISGFYTWLKKGLSKRMIQRNQHIILVKIVHQETYESYGYVPLSKYLRSQVVVIS